MTEDTTRFPEGTVTVLSTDLVDSTALNQRLGDVAATTRARDCRVGPGAGREAPRRRDHFDEGRHDDARILSPAAVAAMTRNQIPGIRARLLSLEAANASWGYGFAVKSPTKWKYFDGSLQPLGTPGHSGARERELVGAYFEVCTRLTDDYEFLWNFNLFQNAITAAVDD